MPTATPTQLAGGSLDLVSYISNISGSNEIHILSLDNTYSRQLTHNDLDEKEIFWAPSAQRLLFTTCDGNSCDIHRIDADGGNPVRLTNAAEDGSSYTEPAWSPDSSQIAFVRQEDYGTQIYLMDADGVNRRQLTSNGSFNQSPEWSPDGTRIAYSSNEFGDYDILTINPDGSESIQISQNDYDDTCPVWSYDSIKIAFLVMADTQKGTVIFMANADGTNQQDISSGVFDINCDVAWSPTSSAIAFSAFPDRNHYQIYLVFSDFWGGTQYSVNKLQNFHPSWAPDGERLAYLADSQIYINIGGTLKSYQLTFEQAQISTVAWVPIQPRKP